MLLPLPDPPATVPGLLERAAVHFPERGIAVFDGRGRSYERRTYPEVLASVRRAAARWSALGVGAGDRVLVCLPTSWDWLEAWLGAVLCGALPIAVARGAALGAGEAHVRKVEGLVERLAPGRLVVAEGLRRELGRFGARRAAEVAITAEELAAATPGELPPTRTEPGELAFLQLTSGSTGSVRAVAISHRAAIHNLASVHDAIGAPHGRASGWAEAGVAWLPLHHDMGLVGCLFLPFYAGFDLWLFQPNTFLARPRKWLEHLGRHGTAYTTAPNFGYQLCLERVSPEERRELDLAPLENAMTGAEMIRPETVEGFCDAFGPGFRPEDFRPCYGLAESTLAVTMDVRGRGLRTRPLPAGAEASRAAFGLSEVAAVGEPIPGLEVRIAGPGGRRLADGEVGEIRVRGPSVFSGYYNDPEATAEALAGGWLLTGDLGFLHRGELYVTGRIKDLLIVRGTNIMPHEVEWVAEGVTGGGGALRSGTFSVARGAAGEEIVVVVEVDYRRCPDLDGLGREIRRQIGRTLSLPVADLVFVRRGRIPKTTSGKVQRRELRDRYLRGELETLP